MGLTLNPKGKDGRGKGRAGPHWTGLHRLLDSTTVMVSMKGRAGPHFKVKVRPMMRRDAGVGAVTIGLVAMDIDEQMCRATRGRARVRIRIVTL